MYQPLQSSSPPAQNEYNLSHLPAQGHEATEQALDAAGSLLLSQDHGVKSARSSKVIQDDGRPPFSRHIMPSEVGWRPITITAPYILLFSLITIGLMCTLEYLLQRSQRKGAIVCTSSSHALDYMPIVVAVLFGLLWASIDHDVKRYECTARPLGWGASISTLATVGLDCDPGRVFIADMTVLSGLKLTSNCRSPGVSPQSTRYCSPTPMSQTTCDMLLGAGYATATWWILGVTMIAISYVNRKGE